MLHPFLPYYHPTTICFVDDNHAYIDSLIANAPSDWSVLAFTSPEEALQVINQPEELEPLAERCFSIDTTDPQRPVVRLHVNALEQEIKSVQRYSRISAVLIDYAMPTMDGLEFCAQIADKRIRRGLLTGVADEKAAVAAFNKGLINRYIPKQDIDSIEQITPHVQRMQRDYFAKLTERISSSLSLHPPAILAEPELRPVFDEIVRKQKVVEYYLAYDPDGYLMMRADGTLLRLVIINAAQLGEQVNLAEQYDAPGRLLRRLRKGKSILYLYDHPRDYLGHERYPWEEVTLRAQRIDAQNTWYLGIAENPPADIDFNPAECSYNHYLASRQR